MPNRELLATMSSLLSLLLVKLYLMSALNLFIFSLFFFIKNQYVKRVVSMGFCALYSSACLLKLPRDMLPSPKKLADMTIGFAVLFLVLWTIHTNALYLL